MGTFANALQYVNELAQEKFVESYTLEKFTDPELVAKYREVLTPYLRKESDGAATVEQGDAGSLFRKTGASPLL